MIIIPCIFAFTECPPQLSIVSNFGPGFCFSASLCHHLIHRSNPSLEIAVVGESRIIEALRIDTLPDVSRGKCMRAVCFYTQHGSYARFVFLQVGATGSASVFRSK